MGKSSGAAGDGNSGGNAGGSQDDPKNAGGQGPAGGQQNQPAGGKKEDSDPGDGGDLGFTDKQLAYVKGLRKEAADYRTKAKDLESKHSALEGRFSKLEGGLKKLFGDEDSDLTPEQKLEQAQAQNESLAFQSAITEAALENGVMKQDYEYFSFLVSKAAEKLGDNEELTADDIAKLALQAKGRGAPGNDGNSSTSVGGKKEGDGSQSQDPPNPSTGDGEVTLEQFCGMSIGEKSALYQKNQDLYKSLHDQARKAGRLI